MLSFQNINESTIYSEHQRRANRTQGRVDHYRQSRPADAHGFVLIEHKLIALAQNSRLNNSIINGLRLKIEVGDIQVRPHRGRGHLSVPVTKQDGHEGPDEDVGLEHFQGLFGPGEDEFVVGQKLLHELSKWR